MLGLAFFTSGTGVQAASSYLDQTGQNVANADTPGYKRAEVTFQDLVYTDSAAPAAVVAGRPAPTGTQLGSGGVVDDVTGLFTQGPVTPTGRPLDLAVSGTGFFRLAAADGTVTYTRAGSFGVDALGRLVSTDGLFVAPGITVPAGSTSVTVGADGTVTAVTPTGTQVVGQVGLTRFRNPAGLLRVAATRFAATPAAGPAADGVPGDPGFGTLQPSSLEGSNVDLPTELVNLILAQRSFQANTQAIQVESDLLAATAQLVQ